MTEHAVAAAESARRALFVHAHPDDETIGNGATIARYVAEGVHVTVVTCTRGEEGPVLRPELAHLAADREDRLGEHRARELAAALAVLGVRDHRWLGGAGTYRDSGDRDVAPGLPAGCFRLADLREAADHLVAVIREVRPQVLVADEPGGGYGHPDHVQAHRVATYATALAATAGYAPELGRPWEIARVYWNALPASVFRRAFPGYRFPGGPPSMVVDDAAVTARVDASAYRDRKRAALRAHATQIDPALPVFTVLSDGVEYYRLAHRRPPGTMVSDLFDGTR
ncbi:N-acetyl-1-D-myo-inositol-2-amino-2-deoxy-alpha-D-glucopyranoside deacetylase [Prauserella shujinwangii]|uniref:N-acetyl-1-D-myo-inositol-2-amino-2-deoxy-alpha-D-glucopyranoside deacetylase n=1 Tax=Prauserella shujinwangii TaxID=1453103 RepID=A0A2T0LSJ2_9PSEU|nr:N-acetyl-1-D-myo-inositol-2-amino-2-deoxy-alpha-D-glucopyranoside deacetylase [Prauserella shujinwangii]PRX46641.1 N-acetyl-1-D-myo-inositol-2-amino-2-deoxy-alpha-D-glucopyranoside deacetylase [Prauserella shujinwangii]